MSQNQNKPFKIYKASAGSGKTFTIVKEYLTLCLGNTADAYREILAVTFTNKAANEMKAKILSYILGIIEGSKKEDIEQMRIYLISANGLDENLLIDTAVAVQERHFNYIYVRWNGQTAIRKRGAGDIWQGLWEPLVMSDPMGHLLKSGVKHQLTHRTLIVDFYLWEPSAQPELPEGYIWIKETELDRYAKPRLLELLLESL